MERLRHPTARVEEVLGFLKPRPGGVYVDATIGPGGHAEAILRSVSPPPTVIGIDCDGEMLALARRRLAQFADHVHLVHGWHSQIAEIVRGLGFEAVDGVLVDAGTAMQQLVDPVRGMSLFSDEPLDARYDRSQPLTAYTVVNAYAEDKLAEVLALTGKRRMARKIAKAIVRRRAQQPIRTPREFAEVVHQVLGRSRRGRVDAATEWLAAVRQWVNRELDELEGALRGAAEITVPGGRIVALTWDGGQHRVARAVLQSLARGCICPPHVPCTCGRRPVVKLLTPRGLPAPPEELKDGPATLRTCRLFAAEKLAEEAQQT